MERLRGWIKANATFSNLMLIGVMLVSLLKNTGQFALQLSSANADNAKAIAEQARSLANLTVAVASLSSRVDQTERAMLTLNESIAKEFPRRSELDPRLKAIEEQVREANMMSRRLYERYRQP